MRFVRGFSVSPSAQTVAVGEVVTMTCQTEYDEHVVWRFYRHGERPTTLSSFCRLPNAYKAYMRLNCSVPRNYELIVSMINVSMSGTYECVENNGFGSRGSIQISVLPRKFNVTSSSQVVQVGERVVLRCVTGLESYVYWYFRRSVSAGRELISAALSFKKDYQLEINGTGYYNLVIPRANLNNTGIYECVEDMGFGPGRGKVELNVEIPVGTPQIVQVGNTAKLACDIGSNFPLRWTYLRPRNGTSVDISNGSVMLSHRDTHSILLNTNKSLVIRNVKHEHTGTYQCQTEVSGEQHVMNVQLMAVHPGTSNILNHSVEVEKDTVLPYNGHFNQSMTWLFCKSESVLKMEICSVVSAEEDSVPEKYTSNNRVVMRNHSIEIRNVTMNDAGMYYCIGTAQLAEPLFSIQLRVSNEGISIVFIVLMHSLVEVIIYYYCYYYYYKRAQ